MVLPFLMTTNTIRGKDKKQWKPSKLECLEGFITHLKSPADLQASISIKEQRNRRIGATLQPYIVLVGQTIEGVHTRYVIVNNIKYNVTSISHAVDVCFKVIFALNAKYPAECLNVWQFLQKGIYKINTKEDKTYTAVNSLLSDLEIS